MNFHNCDINTLLSKKIFEQTDTINSSEMFITKNDMYSSNTLKFFYI